MQIETIVSILALLGSIAGVYVNLSNRLTRVETRLDTKADKDKLLEKIDEMRISLEKKIESEIQKLELHS
jgi:hypothetical protein